MFRRIQSLFLLLTKQQRKKLLQLQALVIVMAFAELASIVAIGPFMALVADIGRLEGGGALAQLYELTGFSEPEPFLFWLGVGVLATLALAASVSIYTSWRLSLYAQQVGAELSVRLYRHYMQQPWLFHASGSSSQLVNKVAHECNRVTNQLIQPLMQMNAKVILSFVLLVAIFVFNPGIALVGLVVFASAYGLLYWLVRRTLSHKGTKVTQANRLRFKLMNEGFGGIKDTLLLGRQADFNQRFQAASIEYGRAQGVARGLTLAPRYAIELIAFGAVIFLVLYLLAAYEGELGSILPMLSLYALAGFKLLPAFQQIYTGVASIKSNLAAFDGLEADLKQSQQQEAKPAQPANQNECITKLSPQEHIELHNICFTYPGKQQAALQGLTLRIPVNQVVGLVGASGSGKSTAIDLLLGLLEPQQGELRVDNQPIRGKQKRAWQNNIGLVSQSIFLADGSVRENIAFGLPAEQIDEHKVRLAATRADLDALLDELPEGLDTRVGERGVQLSGGQRQRIGIARALYDDAEVLVLDEATSALDGVTEKRVMNAILSFSGNKTIVMIAHRLATVRQCDCIYLLDKGKLLDAGSFDQLVKRNKRFKQLAERA